MVRRREVLKMAWSQSMDLISESLLAVDAGSECGRKRREEAEI